MGIPILLTSFIEELWSHAHMGRVNIADMLVQHHVPLLYGCSISFTGAPPDERSRMGNLIVSHGGNYSADMNSSCTHLVVSGNVGKRSSPKIAFAKKWDIPIVSSAWLLSSISKGMCLDTAAFLLNSDEFSSQLAAPTQSFLYDDITVEDINRALDVPKYLADLHIYVGEGGSGDRSVLLKKLILIAGGTRHTDLFDKNIITHYIIHNQTLTPKELEQLRSFRGTTPLVVHDQWLFACFYSKGLVPLDGYLINMNLFLTESEAEAMNSSKSCISLSKSTTSSRKVGTSWSLKLPSTSFEGPPRLDHGNDVNNHSSSTALPPTPTPKKLPIFSGKSFGLLFSESSFGIRRVELIDIIERNGGTMKGLDDSPDFIIAPCVIDEEDLPEAVDAFVINELWLEHCCSERKFLSTTEPFFQSLRCSSMLGVKDRFKDIRISVSGFLGAEREFYGKLAAAMCATFTENLTKKNTHLICATPSGPKFDFASSHDIHCVSPSWLIESACVGSPIDPYSLQYSSPSVVDMRPNYIYSMGHYEKENKKQNTQEHREKDLGTSTSKSDNLDVHTKKPIEKGNGEMAPKIPLTGPTQQCESQSLFCETKDSFDSILKGCSLAISQRLWHRREELHDLIIELGGHCPWTYDSSCTHYVHQGNIEDETFREFKIVRKDGKWIVSPWWLQRCKDSGRRLPESEHPHTFNPNAPPAQKILAKSNLATNVCIYKETVISETEPPMDIDFDSILAMPGRKKPKVTFNYDTVIKSPPETPSRPKVAFSGLSPDCRSSFSKIALQLGFEISQSNTGIDMDTTHLVTAMPSKSEKFLSACAAGCWILRPEWIESCESAAKVATEKEHEWGAAWTEQDDSMLKLPRYWREYCKSRRMRAFKNWTVLLAADQKRLLSLKSILEVGQARVFLHTDTDNFDFPSAEKFTHFLYTSRNMRGRIGEAIQEALRGKEHPVEYIADYLFNISSNKRS